MLRLGAALPFIAGVAVTTVWLHRRVGALSGLLFLFFSTVSPLLLDLSRQARGYGLAFLAMSVMTVAALELERSRAAWAVAAFPVAGVVGSWTLPHFAVAFITTAVILLALGIRRRALASGLALACAAILVWYAPHVGDIVDRSQDQYSVEISTRWLVTAPLDQTVVPAVSLSSDDYLHPNLASLALVALFAVVMAVSPLLRRRETALILCGSVVTTVLTFWVTDSHAAPRFFSFLLVPLFMLLATGAAAGLGRLWSRRPSIGGLAAVTMLLVVGLAAVDPVATTPRRPREAFREVAQAIDSLGTPAPPVFAYVPHPGDLEFHLDRRVTPVVTAAGLRRACSRPDTVVVVTEIWLLDPVAVPCSGRQGVRHTRFAQYARGGAIDMWVVPRPRSSS